LAKVKLLANINLMYYKSFSLIQNKLEATPITESANGATAYVCKKNKVKCLIAHRVSELVDETGNDIFEDRSNYRYDN